MADRKISELNQASRVYDADYMVVVTGVNQTVPGQSISVEKVTTKFPLSGLATWIFRVNELVQGVSGVRVTEVINTGQPFSSARPNEVLLSLTGVSYSGHTHTASNILDFNSSVDNLIQQKLTFLNQDTNNSTAGDLIYLTGSLEIELLKDSRYVCELGLIVSGDNSNVSGMVSTSGTRGNNNNLLGVYGTWNYLSGTDPVLYSSSTPMTGLVNLANNISGVHTLMNKFSINTYSQVGDYISFAFTSDSTARILKGSWLKAEKVI